MRWNRVLSLITFSIILLIVGSSVAASISCVEGSLVKAPKRMLDSNQTFNNESKVKMRGIFDGEIQLLSSKLILILSKTSNFLFFNEYIKK